MPDTNLDSLSEEALDLSFTNSKFPLPPLTLDTIKFIKLNPLPFGGFTQGTLPKEQRNFLLEYFNFLINSHDSDIHLTEEDIHNSEFSANLRFYFRCLEKLLFDFCLYKGLNFKDYQIQTEINLFKDFDSFVFDYKDSMYNFYIFMLLKKDEPCVDVLFDPFSPETIALATGIPFIVSSTPDLYFSTREKIPAIMIKVKGV